ncbi:MAG: hypothetical protein JW395_3132 [Nitrospira sp.]|nr:hypothetical protein [Nitrospira sp.]
MIRITGLDDLQRNLQKIERRAKNLSGEVSFDDLFPPEFMREHTDFNEIGDLIKASGYEVNNADDFRRIPEAEWDALVAAKTRFGTWEEMQAQAGREYAIRRLGIGD